MRVRRGQDDGADQGPEPSHILGQWSMLNKPICKRLSIFEIHHFIARHFIDSWHPLVQVFIEYDEFALMRLAVRQIISISGIMSSR